MVKVRRGGTSDPAIHRSDVESEKSLPDALLAIEQSRTPRFVTDEVTGRTRWRRSLAINLAWCCGDGHRAVVFIATKFVHGAWLVVIMVPLLVLLFHAVHRHYVSVAKQLSLEKIHETLEPIRNTVIVPVSGIHRGVLNALRYARSIAPDSVTAVYVDLDDEATAMLKARWEKLDIDIKLVVLPSPYRELTRPILKFIYRVDRLRDDDIITVVIPEFVPNRWWQHLLHNQSSLLLKAALLFRENVIVTNVPYHLR